MSLRKQGIIIVLIMLCINAGVILYTYDSSSDTGKTACDAANLIGTEVQHINQRNMNIVFPQLHNQGQLNRNALETLQANSLSAILRLEEAKGKCLDVVDGKN